jgi:hypothetical protein
VEAYLKTALRPTKPFHGHHPLAQGMDELLREQPHGAIHAHRKESLLTLATVDPSGQGVA